jgi:hypothetical protein
MLKELALGRTPVAGRKENHDRKAVLQEKLFSHL